MLNLLRKDFVINRVAILVFFALISGYLGWLSSDMDSAMVYVAFGGVMFGMVPLSIIAREDKAGAAALSCSLPVSRETIVRSRYVEAWLIMLVGLGYAIVLNLVLPWSQLEPSQLLAVPVLAFGLCVVTLGLTTLLPFVLRFGMVGIMVFLVVVQLLGVVAFLAVSLTTHAPNIRELIVGTAQNISALRNQLGPPLFYVSLLTLAALLHLASYLCSLVVFKRRDF